MWQTISNTADPLLDEIEALYISSFPQLERRQWSSFLELLPLRQMQLIAIIDANTFIGFIVYWKFASFSFIEHFAILPAYRSLGFGAKAMHQFVSQNAGITILEVELPTDHWSIKRLDFYTKKLAFYQLPFAYRQPPYQKHLPPIPMLLLASQLITDALEFNDVATTIRQQVYEKFY